MKDVTMQDIAQCGKYIEDGAVSFKRYIKAGNSQTHSTKQTNIMVIIDVLKQPAYVVLTALSHFLQPESFHS